ncbi:MAG: glycosyl hydrolase [Acidobacteriaceae bacterium]
MNNLFASTLGRRNRRAIATWVAIAACVIGLVACAFMLLAQPCFAQSTVAQHPWQKMQMPSASEVARVWNAPPPEYGPEPYYGLNGDVTREVLQRDLDKAVRLGFHAVTVQPGRNPEAYLSPEYFAMFKVLVEEAKKRDLRVWIIDDAGYPSGFAGGLITDKKPELRMQALSIGSRIPVKAGETLDQAVGSDAVAAVAVSSNGERIPVAVTDGKIAWTAPRGSDYMVDVVEHVFRTSPTASATNATHLKDTTQSVEDYMDPEATAAWMQFTHEGYYKAMPEEFGKTIIGFRGDEPDYSISGLPWTPKFFDTFERVKGYDIRPYLGALLLSAGGGGGRPRPAAAPGQGGAGAAAPVQTTQAPRIPSTPPVQLTDAEVRAKGDYYDVFSQMFRDGFFKPQGLWCAAHGVEYQVHLNHEEMEMQLVRSEGEFERDMKYVEVPGIDAIWHQIWTDTISDYPRLASSTAHIYGHPRSFTESFGAYRPAPDVTMARYVLDEQIIRGINVTEGMSYGASSSQGPPRVPPAPTPAAPGAAAAPPRPQSAMSDPAWPTLMDHVRRLSYVMSMGRPAASVALYIPSSSMWLGDSASDTAFVSSERMLSERQIDFDIINLDALATDLKAGPGTFETMSGNKYRVVILPSLAVISQAELDRLKAFAKGGGKVLFLGRTPSMISQKTIMDSRAATPADFAWATVETSAQLPPTPTPPGAPPAEPPAPQVVPAAIETALNAVIGPRDVALDSPDTALKVMTRRLKDANVYLFFNEGAQASAHSVTLKSPGKTVEVWDTETGKISTLASTADKGSITVKLALKPYETELLTVR